MSGPQGPLFFFHISKKNASYKDLQERVFMSGLRRGDVVVLLKVPEHLRCLSSLAVGDLGIVLQGHEHEPRIGVDHVEVYFGASVSGGRVLSEECLEYLDHMEDGVTLEGEVAEEERIQCLIRREESEELLRLLGYEEAVPGEVVPGVDSEEADTDADSHERQGSRRYKFAAHYPVYFHPDIFLCSDGRMIFSGSHVDISPDHFLHHYVFLLSRRVGMGFCSDRALEHSWWKGLLPKGLLV